MKKILVVKTIIKNIHISWRKLQIISKKLKNKNLLEVICIIKTLSEKMKNVIWKAYYSAMSNAINNFNFNKEKSIIYEIFVTKGLSLKRLQCRAKGKFFFIKKRYSHLTIKIKNK